MFGKRSAGQMKKQRLALGGLALALILLLVFVWTGYNLSSNMENVNEYQIIHDGYTEKQALYPTDPAAGLIQQLPDGAGETLYGLRLMFATNERVAHGGFLVELLEGDAQTVVASCTRDMTLLLDGAFIDVLFDAPVTLNPGEHYRLHVSFVPHTEQDIAGLVYGAGELAQPELALYEGGSEPTEARTAAMQYITNHVDSRFAVKLFAPIALIVFVTLMLGWWLIFVKKARLDTLFVVFAVGLGLVWTLVTPPLAAPDEYVHTAGAYNLASRLTGGASAEENLLPMRAGDAAHMLDHSGPIGPIAYKEEWDGLTQWGVSSALTESARVRVPVSVQPVQYLGQTLGILLARLLGLGYYPMLLMGRVFNLLLFILLTALAIRFTPVGKQVFFTVGLLPACLSLAGSLSADPVVIGLAFLFAALCLKGRYGKRTFGTGLQVTLVVLAALLAPAKAIYVMVILLCLIIPAERMGGSKRSVLVKAGAMVAALAGWIAANGSVLKFVFRSMDLGRMGLAIGLLAVLAAALLLCWRRWGSQPVFRRSAAVCLALLVLLAVLGGTWVMQSSGIELTPEEYAEGIRPNGDSIYTFSVGYVLSHLPQTIKLVVNTFAKQLPVYLQGLVGTLPGEPIVYGLELSWTMTIALLLLLLAVSMRQAGQPHRLTRKVRMGMGAVVVLVAMLVVAACISWTPINWTVIFGIQGRYLLPILPLALLWLGDCDSLAFQKNRESGLCLTSGLLAGAAALEALLLFAVG